MDIDTSPYLEANKNVKYTFYCLIITAYDEDNATCGTQELVSKLTGYAVNEWVFRSYLRYYRQSLKYATTIMITYDDMIYREFQDRINTDFNVVMNDDNFIDMDSIDLINETIFFNGLLNESMMDYHADFDDMTDVFIPALFQGYELLCLGNRKYFTDKFSVVQKLLERVCKLYIPIIKLLEDGGYEGEEWFLSLPDYAKLNITKEANFSRPLEELGWYDIVCSSYQLYHYVNTICDYTGAPEDG